MIQTIDRVVHVGVPESTTIRIERHRTVITPTSTSTATAVSGLGSGPLNQNLLSLAEGIDGIGRQSARVLNRRLRRAAGRAVTQRHVSGAVHGQTRHETMHKVSAVRIKGRGLCHVRRDGAAGYGNLIKARRCKTGGVCTAHSMSRP